MDNRSVEIEELKIRLATERQRADHVESLLRLTVCEMRGALGDDEGMEAASAPEVAAALVAALERQRYLATGAETEARDTRERRAEAYAAMAKAGHDGGYLPDLIAALAGERDAERRRADESPDRMSRAEASAAVWRARADRLEEIIRGAHAVDAGDAWDVVLNEHRPGGDAGAALLAELERLRALVGSERGFTTGLEMAYETQAALERAEARVQALMDAADGAAVALDEALHNFDDGAEASARECVQEAIAALFVASPPPPAAPDKAATVEPELPADSVFAFGATEPEQDFDAIAAMEGEFDDPDAPEPRAADALDGGVRRAANWTPPTIGGQCYEGGPAGGPCAHCGRLIRDHYGGTEYRCDPRPDASTPATPAGLQRCETCGCGVAGPDEATVALMADVEAKARAVDMMRGGPCWDLALAGLREALAALDAARVK